MKKLLVIFTLIGAFACNQPQEESAKIVEEDVIIEEIVDPLIVEEIPALPIDEQEKLFEKCNAIEATFYLTAQSMASNGANLSAMLSLIDFQSTPTKLIKEEQGHLLFLENGNELAFGKISLSEETNYIKFTVGDTTYYSNLSAQGVQFFHGIALPPQN